MPSLKLPGGFFRVSAADNWGDHGTILINGFIGEPFVKDGPASLYRTGPFIPAVTAPNDRIIATDAARQVIDEQVGELTWQPVVRRYIAAVEWHGRFLRGERLPSEFASREPESLILDNPPSPTTADQMPKLWQSVLTEGAQATVVDRGRGYALRIKRRTWRGDDLFSVHVRGGTMVPVVTGRAREVIEQLAGDWLRWEELATE